MPSSPSRLASREPGASADAALDEDDLEIDTYSSREEELDDASVTARQRTYFLEHTCENLAAIQLFYELHKQNPEEMGFPWYFAYPSFSKVLEYSVTNFYGIPAGERKPFMQINYIVERTKKAAEVSSPAASSIDALQPADIPTAQSPPNPLLAPQAFFTSKSASKPEREMDPNLMLALRDMCSKLTPEERADPSTASFFILAATMLYTGTPHGSASQFTPSPQ